MPPRADAARNAELLLAAAKELFAERGAEVALDEIARRAGVGNATLYRHFPTRSDLIVAVYSDEVDALCRHGTELLASPHAGEALFAWLDSFVVHIATKRALALAVTESPDERRTRLFEEWHRAITATADRHLSRAVQAGQVRTDLGVTDLLALTSGAAIASSGPEHAQRLLRILRDGFATTKGRRRPHNSP
jgi:AcrR family transcriptional regulator